MTRGFDLNFCPRHTKIRRRKHGFKNAKMWQMPMLLSRSTSIDTSETKFFQFKGNSPQIYHDWLLINPFHVEHLSFQVAFNKFIWDCSSPTLILLTVLKLMERCFSSLVSGLIRGCLSFVPHQWFRECPACWNFQRDFKAVAPEVYPLFWQQRWMKMFLTPAKKQS